jgi:hypothetical protein
MVLAHESHDVDDLNGHVFTVVTDTGYRGDSVPWALDLRSLKAMVVHEEAQAVRCYLDERRPPPHEFSISRSGCPADYV